MIESGHSFFLRESPGIALKNIREMMKNFDYCIYIGYNLFCMTIY